MKSVHSTDGGWRFPSVLRQVGSYRIEKVFASPDTNFAIASLASTEFFQDLDPETIEDAARQLEWVNLEPGDVLMRQGEVGDSLYILISGRLSASVRGADDSEKPVGEIAQGETVGEMALISDERRSATVAALRSSLLARLPRTAFETLYRRRPEVLMRMAQLLARRLRDANEGRRKREAGGSIALLAATPGVPLRDAGERLHRFLARIAPTLPITRERVEGAFGQGGFTRREYSAWLAEQEQRHRFIIFEADGSNPAWARSSLRHADRVLILARTDQGEPGAAREFARSMGFEQLPARRDLVLLHAGDRMQGSAPWLEAFGSASHHHVRLEVAADYERLARIVSGRAVGLTLGGGGARGYAHIGVAKALREAAIPIDFVGGTSMGAVMAGEIALGWTPEEMLERSEAAFRHDPFRGDYTLPVIGVSTARKIVRVLTDLFGDARIEDQWRGFFCVSCNLTRGEMVVSRQGLFRQCIRASTSLPAYWPPVMRDGEMLVDGAIINNLPGDLMKQVCDGPVIAVDVSSRRELTADFADSETLSGWEALRKRRTRGANGRRPANIVGVVMRTILLNSIMAADEIRRTADWYLHPPVESIDMFDLPAIHRAAEIGYRYTMEQLEAGAWKF